MNESASMTSMDLSLRETRMARHSSVNSSMMFEHADPAPVVGAIVEEVVGPDVVAVLGRQADDTFSPSRRQIRSTRFVIDQPAGPAQQGA
jgi:hypothetical protein